MLPPIAFFAVLVVIAMSRARLTAPEPGLLLRDRTGRFLGEIAGRDGAELGYWPLRELPPRVAAATLAVEDRRFYHHPGVDPLAAGRAALQNVRLARRVSGASTIAMQVARMQEPEPRSYLHKTIEALTAVMLTARYGRSEILSHYLRIAPYGNRIHGIACAARRYFDKPIEDLSWAETAFLTALPQAPGRMNPHREKGRLAAIARGRRILDLLRDEGALSPREHRVAVAEIEGLVVPPRERRPESGIHPLLRLARALGDPAARAALASRGPITTTFDLDLQEQVEDAAAARVRYWADRGAGNAAVVVVERGTREVRAAVGSTGYFDAGRSGAIDFTTVPRSPGSILKPFLYALALEKRTITSATVLDDLQRGPGGLANADDLYLGPLLPRVALANSRNVPAAELLQRIGLDEGAAFLHTLGLGEGALPARHYGLGLAIGGMPVRLEDLVRAYAVLADDGRLGDLVWYRGQPLAPERRVISEETARQITLFLSDPMARLPTFPRMGPAEYAYPVAVKTGTSSSFRDAWAVAWSQKYIVGVWVGDPACRPMNHLSGYNAAAALAQDVMNRLHGDEQDGLRDLQFPPPRGFRAARVCALTGRLAGEACPQVFLEWFRPGEEPVDACAAHVRFAIDVRDGRPATSRTPRSEIEVRTFVDLGPRYAAWAADAGLVRPPLDAIAPSAGVAAQTGTSSRLDHRATQLANVRVVSPENGISVIRDPETPAALATLALSAVVDPPAPQVVWYVDGAAFEVADYPYTARWPLVPGAHVFQARVPYSTAASRTVRVEVQ